RDAFDRGSRAQRFSHRHSRLTALEKTLLARIGGTRGSKG
ncbi:hypothetical protein ALC62_13706, partial [Cyphomyrmex costatus]